MKYQAIRDDYPLTKENEYAYTKMLYRMDKRDLIVWVSIRQGYTLREVAEKILPSYGYPPCSHTLVRRSLLKTHAKLANLLD
jgi:hypothetical protein